MKQSTLFMPTLREVPADAEIKSHQLLLRAGYMRQTASGIYSYLPLAMKVLQKIETIVREEMNNTGASELLMPALHPAETWKESGRWDVYGPELFRLKDRHNRDFALGATHEEVITQLVRDEVKSYKRLPLALYQIQSKFRDEQRPRFGLLRGREFIMKDGYSFHASQESLDEYYEKVFTAYQNIFRRCGLDFRAVIADSGAMGGKDTHEFMVLSEVGEDTIAYSTDSDYAANVEMAPVVTEYTRSNEEELSLEKFETPDAKTIAQLEEQYELASNSIIKSLVVKVDEEYVLALVRGDHELNDIKIKNLLNASVVEFASPEETKSVIGTSIGSIGPLSLPEGIKIIADNAVAAMVNAVTGANEEGYHYKNVNPDRDIENVEYADLRFIQEGDVSPDGNGVIAFAKGIEVGHVFKLGTKYSEAMGGLYLDENGRNQPYIMGCYGIGVSRTLAAIAEQYHDENGLTWPSHMAPFNVHVIPVNVKDDTQVEVADKIYTTLQQAGMDVLIDDRKERAGVKFTDSDLFGIPARVTVGKRASEGMVEIKVRQTGEVIEASVDEILQILTDKVK
ncbi:proline--tRNA ligase [Mangrovibacillus cuniculi]|uniref:Proline--tRNA ligase n=1 Tax=Mangrovibacillus cuniculi TaxID=2593652 RepID=A0A7S8CAF2_9BACI|nr:proline--tRNA ligase [Mangrovibacillus cuniculi]QPC46379.1 proline--tRNA ligase [Mangrovibacillus cuniculi]